VAFILSLLIAASGAFCQEDSARQYYYEAVFTPFFVKDAAHGVYRASRKGATPGSFLVQKPADGFRVFVLGGSIAQGYNKKYALGDALSRVLPSRKIEFLNCGMGGYDSYREAMLLDEVLEYSPDLIVLMTGHNEGLGSPPVPLWILRAQDRLSRWSVYRDLAEKFKPPQRYEGSPAESAQRRNQAFESNLKDMLTHAKAKGVPLVVIAPPLDYADEFPHQTYPLEDASFMEGRIRYLRGDYAGAMKIWQDALAHDGGQDDKASLLFYMGRAARKLGRLEEADKDYEAAAAADWTSGGRCTGPCQESIKRIAVEEGGIWANVDGAFKSVAAPGLPGLDMLYDTVHWFGTYDALISCVIIKALRADERFKSLPWDLRRADSLDEKWSRGMRKYDLKDESLRTLRNAFARMGQKSRFDWSAVLYLDSLNQRYPRWFGGVGDLIARADAGFSGNRAWGRQPLEGSPAVVGWYFAEMLIENGRFKDAIGELQSCLRQDPSLRGAQLSVVIAEALSGDTQEAHRLLEQVQEPEMRRARDVLSEVLK